MPSSVSVYLQQAGLRLVERQFVTVPALNRLAATGCGSVFSAVLAASTWPGSGMRTWTAAGAGKAGIADLGVAQPRADVVARRLPAAP